MTQDSRSGSLVRPTVPLPEPQLHTAAVGSRFGFRAPSFVGPQSTHDYEQQRTKHQGRSRTPPEGNSSGQHQPGTRNKDAIEGTPVSHQTAGRRSYAETLRLPSPRRPAAPRPTPLSTIKEHQGNIAQRTSRRSKLRDVFGGASDSSLTSGSDIEFEEESLAPKPRNKHPEVDGDEPQAKERPSADNDAAYRSDNDGLYLDDPADVNMVDGFQRNDPHVNDDQDVRMDDDVQGDDGPEFPNNLDECTFGFWLSFYMLH